MKKHRLAAFLLFLAFLLSAGLIYARDSGKSSRIVNAGSDTVFYCNSPVVVVPGISIENIDFEKESDGIKISVANYTKGEDTLFYTGNAFSSRWFHENGNLELTGTGTAEEYELAVKQVFYENLTGASSSEPRSFSISLLDADYLPYTGHFYLYIKEEGISWSAARDSAGEMDYYGLQGYLATIISSVENDFIWSKIDGVGWIGASDAEKEGTWKWVTGPEKNTIFWQGNYTGGPVNNKYSFWNTGEPNNLGDEDYAHINYHPNNLPKSWNDLRNTGGGGYYYPQGYIVEFGGMKGDPDVQLSAASVVAWNRKPEMYLTDFDSLVCGELNRQFELKFGEPVNTWLRPLDPGARVIDKFESTPTIQADDFGQYRFVLEITNRYNCTWNDTLEIKFQHQPTAGFHIDDEKCKGYNLELEFTGEIAGPASFFWYSGDTVFASGTELTDVEIPLGFGERNRKVGLRVDEKGCVNQSFKPVSVIPGMKFWVEENAEGCSPLDVQFGNTDIEEIERYEWDFGDGNSSRQKEPRNLYNNPGTNDTVFDVGLTVISKEGCLNTGSLLKAVTVHPIPAIGFDFNEETCYSENATVNYKGSGNAKDNYLWDLSDFHDDEVAKKPGNSSGPLQFRLFERPSVEIGLQVVSKHGCKTDSITKIFTRKPFFDVSAGPLEGCPPLEVDFTVTTPDSVDRVDYLWEMGDNHTAGGSEVAHVYSGADTRYNVTVVARSSRTGCSDTLILPGKVNVFPVPGVSFSANSTSALISDPVISFENQSKGATRYKWDFDDLSGYSAQENPVHRFRDMGLYKVGLLALNDFGCADSASMRVSVAFDQLFPPTAFSPNAGREEDREVRIHAEGILDDGYRLLGFNRWGEVVFESHSQQKGWTGKMKNGNFAPAGVYTWVISYFDFLGVKHNQQGTVNLIF